MPYEAFEVPLRLNEAFEQAGLVLLDARRSIAENLWGEPNGTKVVLTIQTSRQTWIDGRFDYAVFDADGHLIDNGLISTRNAAEADRKILEIETDAVDLARMDCVFTPYDERELHHVEDVDPSAPWDALQAMRLAEAHLGDVEATAALVGLDRTLAKQDWQLVDGRAWWKPGWSPDSLIEVTIEAVWIGVGPPTRPTLSMSIYDRHGRIVRVKDITPDEDEWRSGMRLAITTNTWLVGSGPETVPGQVVFVPFEAEEEDLNIPVLNPGLESPSHTDPNDLPWSVHVSMGIRAADSPKDAVAQFIEWLWRQDPDSLVYRIEERGSAEVHYCSRGVVYDSRDYLFHLHDLT